MRKGSTTEDNSLFEVITLLSDLVVFNHYGFDEFLKKLINAIIKIVPSDSCFIYFHDTDKKRFTLIGSKKPHKGEIGNVVLAEGEGITGWVAEHKQTVAIKDKAYKDSRFKFFSELPEDKYESFLSVPIINGTGVVGVINLQNKKPYVFSKNQIKTVESLVKIISSAFSNVVLERKINSLKTKLEERKLIDRAKGVLMKNKNIGEQEAYRYLQKEAMEKRKSMKDIAQAVLLIY